MEKALSSATLPMFTGFFPAIPATPDAKRADMALERRAASGLGAQWLPGRMMTSSSSSVMSIGVTHSEKNSSICPVGPRRFLWWLSDSDLHLASQCRLPANHSDSYDLDTFVYLVLAYSLRGLISDWIRP